VIQGKFTGKISLFLLLLIANLPRQVNPFKQAEVTHLTLKIASPLTFLAMTFAYALVCLKVMCVYPATRIKVIGRIPKGPYPILPLVELLAGLLQS
jgi:hypothetical protein